MRQVGIQYDEGLRQYMLKVYQHMSIGLIITGVLAFFTANSAMMQVLYQITPEGVIRGYTGLGMVFAFAPLAFVFAFSAMSARMQPSTTQWMFYAYAASMGISLASIFWAYTSLSIVRVFFMAAATFGAMSLYGYTTKRDLTAIGSFLMMGLFGLIIAMVVNLFLGSSTMYFVTSVLMLGIFIGLTAFETQQLRNVYYQMGAGSADAQVIGRVALMGALTLYMSFINIFLILLRFFGDRRE